MPARPFSEPTLDVSFNSRRFWAWPCLLTAACCIVVPVTNSRGVVAGHAWSLARRDLDGDGFSGVSWSLLLARVTLIWAIAAAVYFMNLSGKDMHSKGEH